MLDAEEIYAFVSLRNFKVSSQFTNPTSSTLPRLFYSVRCCVFDAANARLALGTNTKASLLCRYEIRLKNGLVRSGLWLVLRFGKLVGW